MWAKLFEGGNVNGVWIVAAFVISNLISFFGARGSSKDTLKSELLTKTIERQDTLDQRQERMMDDLQEEIRRVKLEMESIQEEAQNQSQRNTALSEKYTTLLKENHSLQSLILQLQREKDDLNEIVKELGVKNSGFVEQIRLLTEEIRKKKE